MNDCCRWIAASWFVLFTGVVAIAPAAVAADKPTVPRTDRYGDPLPEGAIARLGTVRFRQYIIQAVAWSPDGRTLASTSFSLANDQPIRLWDVATGKEVRRMAGGSGDS